MNTYNLLSILDNAKYSSLRIVSEDNESPFTIVLDNIKMMYNKEDSSVIIANKHSKMYIDEPQEIITQGQDVYSFKADNLLFELLIIRDN